MGSGEFGDGNESSANNRLDHQLGDPITNVDGERLCCVGVQQDDTDFSTIASINRSRRVNERDAVAKRETGTRHNERNETVR
jgi:hypothetical protein